MLSIAAIDARCFLEPCETATAQQPSDLDWAWTRRDGERTEPGQAEPAQPTLHSLIVRHFGLAPA